LFSSWVLVVAEAPEGARSDGDSDAVPELIPVKRTAASVNRRDNESGIVLILKQFLARVLYVDILWVNRVDC
jgi:hypothetical protein